MASNKSTTDLKQSQANEKKRRNPRKAATKRGAQRTTELAFRQIKSNRGLVLAVPTVKAMKKRVARWDTGALLQPCPNSQGLDIERDPNPSHPAGRLGLSLEVSRVGLWALKRFMASIASVTDTLNGAFERKMPTEGVLPSLYI